MANRQFLEFHREEPDCLWVTPLDSSIDFRQPEANPECLELIEEINRSGINRLVVDLSMLPFFGSTLLEWIITTWKRMRALNGLLVIFGPTAIGKDVLKVVHIDSLIPIADTREDALRLVREPLTQN